MSFTPPHHYRSPEDGDQADIQVVGLERYVPTRLAKALLVAAIVAPFALFQVVRANGEWFLISGRSPLEQTLIATVAALVLAAFVLAALVIEFAHIIGTHKHRRIAHYTAEHPSFNPKFLWRNTNASHKAIVCLVLALIFALGFAVGA